MHQYAKRLIIFYRGILLNINVVLTSSGFAFAGSWMMYSFLRKLIPSKAINTLKGDSGVSVGSALKIQCYLHKSTFPRNSLFYYLSADSTVHFFERNISRENDFKRNYNKKKVPHFSRHFLFEGQM